MWRNGASSCEFYEKSMETETIPWSEFPNGGKAIVEQILASEERSKSKRAGLWESQSGISVGKLMSKVVWDRKIITEFTKSISSTRIGKPVLLMESPKTKTIADGLIERTSSMLDKTELKNHAQRRKSSKQSPKNNNYMSRKKDIQVYLYTLGQS